MTTRQCPRLLIVGAAHGSLGHTLEMVAAELNEEFDSIVTAGITPDPDVSGEVYEDFALDVTHSGQIKEVLRDADPDIIICTAGVNEPVALGENYLGLKMADAFRINVIGVMELLRHFAGMPHGSGLIRRFVAISSNSARIARRGSLAYCTSKAALSMGLRCAARELGGSTYVWGYEPGLLAGTPMTTATRSSMSGQLHRMRGVSPDGLRTVDLAYRIITDVLQAGPAYNGLLIPFDAGEQ